MDEPLEIEDLLMKILHYACCGDAVNGDAKTYKCIRLVSLRWSRAVGDRIDEFSNHLWTLIAKLGSKVKWNWRMIAVNPNTRPEMIVNLKTKQLKWVVRIGKDKFGTVKRDIFQHFSDNPRLTWEIIEQFPAELWCWDSL